MVLNKLLAILPLFFIQLAATVSLISFRDNFPINLKRLSLIWVFVFMVEVTGHITGMIQIRNFWLYNLFDIVFLFALAFFYYYVLNSRIIKQLIRFFFIVFPLFALGNIIFIQKLRDYNSLNYICGGTFIFLLAATYFWQLYVSEKTGQITRDAYFWFSIGFLVYFGGTVPYLGMYNLLVDQHSGFARFYARYVYIFFSVLLNSLIVVGFLCRKNYPKTY